MDNSKKIAELEEKLAQLKSEQEEYDLLSEDKKLAEFIHQQTCRFNHTDGCGWYYESWRQPSSTSTRAGYLKKATNILKITTFDIACNVIKEL